MTRSCVICGKKPTAGPTIARRGMAKKKGGAGKKITGVTKRTFLPNLQKVRAVIDGRVKTIRVCVKCIRSGKVIKP